MIDLKKKSFFTYNKVILFNYDIQCRRPFMSYPRSMFSSDDIPQSWFTGPLTPKNRRKVLNLPPLGGGRFSVFAKIELSEYFTFVCSLFVRRNFLLMLVINSNLCHFHVHAMFVDNKLKFVRTAYFPLNVSNQL